MKILKGITLSVFVMSVFLSCKNEGKNSVESQKLKIVSTTSMVTDLVKNIGGDHIEVQGLMGAGVDPHLYKASEGDVSKLYKADIIFYNGLHLEGKLVEVFEKMEATKTTIGLGEFLPKAQLIGSDYFASNYDPHVWFNIEFFKMFAEKVAETLVEKDPKNATSYLENKKKYLKQLTELEAEVKAKIETLPKEKRILVTAHDAFNYFGNAYNFNVVGLQGLSTATEAGVQDVQRISQFIMDNNVKAIFVESSVPRRTIEALQKSVESKGQAVKIGGSLFSDALGNPGTQEGTYIGMFMYNVTTIVNELQ